MFSHRNNLSYLILLPVWTLFDFCSCESCSSGLLTFEESLDTSSDGDGEGGRCRWESVSNPKPEHNVKSVNLTPITYKTCRPPVHSHTHTPHFTFSGSSPSPMGNVTVESTGHSSHNCVFNFVFQSHLNNIFSFRLLWSSNSEIE